ncbi:hypothetical protein TARUN_6470 [Trichoderma arundinaceum]|uniref:RING-type domain-containing protein n=1 Tax=Trichoderma arundinaceum TaxID=490622 RepID=A0A395NIG1_TRIAR|nr:hypothetical protein TARUN_6470 [Trichoderma arundinaceum]
MPTVRSERNRRRGGAVPEASGARRTRPTTRPTRSPRPGNRFSPSSDSSSASEIIVAATRRPRGTLTRRGALRRPKKQPAGDVALPASPAAVEDNYWPTVRQYINNGGHGGTNQARIKVSCPICRDELPVRGLDPSPELLQHEGGVVIGCGHIFCRTCLTQTFRAQGEEARKRSCPVCRAEMECQRCGLQGRAVDIPKAHGNAHDFEELPRTVPEGGDQPANCFRCEARDWWIWQVEHGRHGQLGPQDDPMEAGFQRLMYDMMDHMEDNRVPTGMVEVEQQLLGLFQRRFMQLRRERERYIERYVTNRLMGAGRDSWQ